MKATLVIILICLVLASGFRLHHLSQEVGKIKLYNSKFLRGKLNAVNHRIETPKLVGISLG